MNNKLTWFSCEQGTSMDKIKNISNFIGISLPKKFCDLMIECDSGIPIQTNFCYYDVFHKKLISHSLGGFLGFENTDYNLLDVYHNPPEFFPKDLVPFAETGSGDYICFDYRLDRRSLDPEIVLWRHGADIGKDVSFVAKNFEEFINILEEPKDT